MSSTDFAWLAEHGVELFREYRGKWIAVRDGRVVASGATATEVAERADALFPDGRFILQALDEETDVIYAAI